jgi:hypothetical protein
MAFRGLSTSLTLSISHLYPTTTWRTTFPTSLVQISGVDDVAAAQPVTFYGRGYGIQTE